MEQGMTVVLMEKLSSGELNPIDERVWSMNMVAVLEHVNYLVIGSKEYETVEGRLNLELGRLELLVVPMHN